MVLDAATLRDHIDRMVREASREYNAAIEAAVATALASGVGMTRMRLESYPGVRTVLLIDDVPVSEFTVNVRAG